MKKLVYALLNDDYGISWDAYEELLNVLWTERETELYQKLLDSVEVQEGDATLWGMRRVFLP